jgi:hypothetical protein
VDEEGGLEVFGVAGGVGDAEEWVDGVADAAVDEDAGGAEDAALECGVVDGELVLDEAVAPALEEEGVQVGGC